MALKSMQYSSCVFSPGFEARLGPFRLNKSSDVPPPSPSSLAGTARLCPLVLRRLAASETSMETYDPLAVCQASSRTPARAQPTRDALDKASKEPRSAICLSVALIGFLLSLTGTGAAFAPAPLVRGFAFQLVTTLSSRRRLLLIPNSIREAVLQSHPRRALMWS
ncbi:hypothetical protein CFAM422_002655 [Trichoderma lentiforme]|uniref:Transmembrane protein n=1 Tax=Trichoderma lentiforme TaxID=1567552 RepID=A0A9P5CEK3_9HYPO|nr:hypothetical protein CFAM422_002655 [Trichoderma lentiforme]